MPRQYTHLCSFCSTVFVSPEPRRRFCSRQCSDKGRYPSLIERFWARVNKTDTCWLWMGSAVEDGYGVLGYRGKQVRTHRLSWELANGPIPAGLSVLHRCDTPACVNPDHLFVGTTQDNITDKVAKGRQAKGDSHGSRLHPESRPRGDTHYMRRSSEAPMRGERNGSAKLTAAEVRAIREESARGESRASLGRQYAVSPLTISLIARRKTWVHVQ